MGVTIRKKTLSKKGQFSLFLDIVKDNIREKEYLGLKLTGNRAVDRETMNQAKQIRDKREIDLLNDEFQIKKKNRKQEKLIDFFENLVLNNFPDSKNHNTTLSKIKSFSQGDIYLSRISVQWGIELKKYLVSLHKLNTAGLYFRIVRQVLSIAKDEGLIKDNPLVKVEAISREEVQKDFLTVDEIQTLFNTPLTAHPEIKWGFLFACFTGLRYSDIKKLQWADIRGNSIGFRQKKTSELNYIPLSKTALLILDEVRKIEFHKTYIFPLPCNVTTNQNLLSWSGTAALPKKVTFHTSRHTFAVLSLTQGVGIYTVKELLGHKDLKSTEAYSKIVDKLKNEAVNMLPEMKV